MQCPHCLNEMNRGATKCHRCGGEVSYTTVSSQVSSFSEALQVFAFVVVVVTVVWLLVCFFIGGDMLRGLKWGIGAGVVLGFLGMFVPQPQKK